MKQMILYNRTRSFYASQTSAGSTLGLCHMVLGLQETWDKYMHFTEAQNLFDYKSFKTCCNVNTNFSLLQKKKKQSSHNVKLKMMSQAPFSLTFSKDLD